MLRIMEQKTPEGTDTGQAVRRKDKGQEVQDRTVPSQMCKYSLIVKHGTFWNGMTDMSEEGHEEKARKEQMSDEALLPCC